MAKYDKLWYLASPYTSSVDGLKLWRYAQVCKAADILMRAGYLVYSPIAQTVPMAKYGHPESADHTTWDDWKEFDEAFIRKCDGVLVLMIPGWRESVGVSAEARYAQAEGLPIMGVDPVTHDVTGIDLDHLLME